MKRLAAHYLSATGTWLHRTLYLPDSPTRAGMIIVHGLGEHAACYADLVEQVFTSRGVAVSGPDFPGHGESTGVRGDFISFGAVRLVIDEAARDLRSRLPADAPIGLLGHSLGGFHAMLYLQERGRGMGRTTDTATSGISRFDGEYAFAWISSPVIDPGRGQSSWLKALSRPMGLLLPTLRIDTGVRRSACTLQEQQSAEVAADGDGTMKNGGGEKDAVEYPARHSWISARYGAELLRLASVLDPELLARHCPRLLMTHGSEDRITSPLLSRDFFDRMPHEDKRYLLFEGYLHEPFNDARRGTVYQAIADWFDGLA